MSDNDARTLLLMHTRLTADDTHGLGTLEFHHPPGTFALTPASRTALEAIFTRGNLLRGRGIDWGCGVGCLAIAAARYSAVRSVAAIDIVEENVRIANENAVRNGVADKVTAMVGNSFAPLADEASYDFVVANPPASEGDDGFSFRREVVPGAGRYLRPGGLLFLSISSQYGRARTAELSRIGSMRYAELLATSPPVPFDLTRADLLDNVVAYAATEERGEPAYEFIAADGTPTESATTALARWRESRVSPRTRWQVHLFVKW